MGHSRRLSRRETAWPGTPPWRWVSGTLDEPPGVVIPARHASRKQVHAADPTIDGTLVEPVRVARDHTPSERGRNEPALFFFDQRTVAAREVLQHEFERSLSLKVRLFARLSPREQVFQPGGALRHGVERLTLGSRQPVALPRILLAQPLQRGAQERQPDRIFSRCGEQIAG